MILLVIAQLGAPLLLTIWLWLSPTRNSFGLTLQAAAILSVIIAAWLAGIWTIVPRWSLAAIAFFALIAAVKGARSPTSNFGGMAWFQLVISIGLLSAGVTVISEAWRAHQPPLIASIRLTMPLDGNDLVVANGGSRLLLNAHQDMLDPSQSRHRSWQGQSYGVDIVAIRPFGLSSSGFRPADPALYAIFARTVQAPCNGTVSALRDGQPDQNVAQIEQMVRKGNHITLRCNGVDVVMAHLKRDSVQVRPGQQVRAGQTIAAVGNSGMSDEPHLHIHAQLPGTAWAPYSGQPIAMLFDGRFLARNDRI